jgi:hypothetical protein
LADVDTARSVYELRVQVQDEASRQWILGTVGALLGGDASLGTQRVRVEIVLRASGECLVQWMETPRPAELLARKIGNDLDQIGVTQGARAAISATAGGRLNLCFHTSSQSVGSPQIPSERGSPGGRPSRGFLA